MKSLLIGDMRKTIDSDYHVEHWLQANAPEET